MIPWRSIHLDRFRRILRGLHAPEGAAVIPEPIAPPETIADPSPVDDQGSPPPTAGELQPEAILPPIEPSPEISVAAPEGIPSTPEEIPENSPDTPDRDDPAPTSQSFPQGEEPGEEKPDTIPEISSPEENPDHGVQEAEEEISSPLVGTPSGEAELPPIETGEETPPPVSPETSTPAAKTAPSMVVSPTSWRETGSGFDAQRISAWQFFRQLPWSGQVALITKEGIQPVPEISSQSLPTSSAQNPGPLSLEQRAEDFFAALPWDGEVVRKPAEQPEIIESFSIRTPGDDVGLPIEQMSGRNLLAAGLMSAASTSRRMQQESALVSSPHSTNAQFYFTHLPWKAS